MDLTLAPLMNFPGRSGPVVLCILDGVGLGRGDDSDAVHAAHTPTLDRLIQAPLFRRVRAHGTAVGLPSDADMGNSEVGHNALGAGRVFAQGAKLVDGALASGAAFQTDTWAALIQAPTLHLVGLVSDGNVHSHIDHLICLIERAAADGVTRLRVHVLTDGRDVGRRTALTYLAQLEACLAQYPDFRIASGGGRMLLTMDRYEADWGMVQRGWDCHVRGQGRPFASAAEAVQTLYDEDPQVDDQWLPAWVIADPDPVGTVQSGDAVLLFNFRGDRAIEISRAFEGSAPIDTGDVDVTFAGLMQYDGDEHIPARYLVEPPAIDRTVGQYLAAAGRKSFAVSETQKFGHVTFFFNGNRSGVLDADLEQYVEVPSLVVPFDQAPAMGAAEITAQAVAAVAQGWDHVRLNLANGDMVGHTGDFAATVDALQVVDRCVAELEAAVIAAGGVMIVTADHGNADEMLMRDKKTGGFAVNAHGERVARTSHTLNPVPFCVVDPSGRWALTDTPDPGLANIGSTLLVLLGLTPPDDYVPALLEPA